MSGINQSFYLPFPSRRLSCNACEVLLSYLCLRFRFPKHQMHFWESTDTYSDEGLVEAVEA